MRIVLLASMMLGICLGSAMAGLAIDASPPAATPTSAVIFVE